MICTGCGHENPDRAKFCLECGTAFTSRCSACGTDLPGGAKFCLECGARVAETAAAPQFERDPRAYTPKYLADKILTSRAALEGERKQVTVLFADVKGSMELAEQLDPEAWHRILERFFEILTEGVHRFEGTINQYTGDGVMALFGAPIAHEDHAQRACYAALQLRDEVRRYAAELRRTQGLNFSFRMGINSGEVVVGKIGDDLRMDYTAQGHTVGLAQRVEQLAAADTAYLTEATAGRAEGFFRLRDLGPFALKGAHEPLHVYELEAPSPEQTRLEVSRRRGLTHFVGRRDEMSLLDAALARAREGHGAVVGVVGEAGVGKSRLCLEFVERCRAQGVAAYEAHCPSHGKNVPFLPILELFRNFFGVTEQDDPVEARRKIAGVLILLDPGLQDVLPVLFEFLGVGDPKRPAPQLEPEARQRQLFALIHRVAQAQTERGEVAVVLIDDLHWVDRGSDAFVAQLVAAAENSRRLVLLNFRPEYQAEWNQRSYYQQLPLVPLDRRAVHELVESLLGRQTSVRALPEQIERWTGGNPFFTEEVIRTLIETGQLEGSTGAYRLTQEIEQLEVPSSVQALLAARIDRLPEPAREVLRDAAVIGREFSGPVLEAIVELAPEELAQAIEQLKAGDFVYERALYPVTEYAFKHPLTHEIAYKTQLQSRRARTHAAAAQAIEELASERIEERAALLAYHWEEAGHPYEAALWQRRAARWTEDTDPSESLSRWQKVRSLLSEVADSPDTAPLRVEACRGILSAAWRVGLGQADEVFAEGKALAEQIGDLRSVAILFNVYGNAKGTAGDLRAYHRCSLEALQLAERLGDSLLQATIAADAHAFCWTGRLQEAVDLTEQGIALGPDDLTIGLELFGISAYLLAHMFRGEARVEMGQFEEAASALDEASRHPVGQPSTYIWSQTWHVIRAYRCGDAPGALAHAQRAVERAEERADSVARVVAAVGLGAALVANGEWRAAEEAERRALELARKRGVGFGISALALHFLAEARLGQGDHAAALECAQEALADARKSGAVIFEIDALLMRARVLLRANGARSGREVERDLADASRLIDDTGARVRAPLLSELSGELARLRGEDEAAKRALREARRLYAEMGASGHAERLAQELAAVN